MCLGLLWLCEFRALSDTSTFKYMYLPTCALIRVHASHHIHVHVLTCAHILFFAVTARVSNLDARFMQFCLALNLFAFK